jgi:hypothetical protein
VALVNLYRPGDMYTLVDQNGDPKGLCIFIELVEPGHLTLKETDQPMHWHAKVLHSGNLRHYDTTHWTLIATHL